MYPVFAGSPSPKRPLTRTLRRLMARVSDPSSRRPGCMGNRSRRLEGVRRGAVRSCPVPEAVSARLIGCPRSSRRPGLRVLRGNEMPPGQRLPKVGPHLQAPGPVTATPTSPASRAASARIATAPPGMGRSIRMRKATGTASIARVAPDRNRTISNMRNQNRCLLLISGNMKPRSGSVKKFQVRRIGRKARESLTARDSPG